MSGLAVDLKDSTASPRCVGNVAGAVVEEVGFVPNALLIFADRDTHLVKFGKRNWEMCKVFG